MFKPPFHVEMEKISRRILGQKELKEVKKSATKIQHTSLELDAQIKILSFSGTTWQKISADATGKNLVSIEEKAALTTAIKIPSKIP